MSSPSAPSVTRSTDDDNPFTFTTEIIILLGVALGLFFTLIICCCCIVRKRKEKKIEVTRSAIQERRVTPSQLLDAGMSPQSVVEVGAATPSQLVDEGLARPHEVDLRNQAGVPIHLATPDELLKAGYTPSQLSTYSVVHRNKDQQKASKKTVVGSDETLKKALSNGPKRVVVEPSQGTIYTGPIKRVVKDDSQTEIYDPESKAGQKIDVTNTFSTWMSPKAGKKKTPEPSTVPSNYKQLEKNESPGRVVVVESNVSRKGSMATDVNELKESKVMPQNNVSKVETVSPTMKTHRGSKDEKMVSKTISKKVVTKSMSPRTNKKGSSKYDVED